MLPSRLVPFAAAMLLATLAGCGRHDDHAHATPQSAQAAASDEHGHEGHEHHEHEEKDEHDHEHDHSEHAETVRLTGEAAAHAGIRTEPVKLQRLASVLSVPARVDFNAGATAHVGSALTGRVASLHAMPGDRVKAGDVLLVLDSVELGEAQSDLLMKIAAAKAAAPMTDLARLAYERGKSLHAESQGLSLTEVQRREAEWRSAEATAATAQAAVGAARNRLRLMGMSENAIDKLVASGKLDPRASIVAPITGEVIDREVTLGELVRPDKDAIFILADLGSLWILADVPESRLGEVVVGAKAETTFGRGSTALPGVVAAFAPQVDPATRTVTARIELRQPAEAGSLRPGMYAQVSLETNVASPEPVLAVPDGAIQQVEGSSVVFVPVEGEENTFAKRPVKTGPRVGALVPISGGLREGENVVVSGTFLLKAEHGKSGAAHEH